MDKIKNKLLSNDGVLFLQGVFKKDCKRMEDMFREKIIVENTNDRETKLYDKIPVIFTSLNDWFKSTNLHCWFCSRTFKNRPWFEPQSIEPVSEISNGAILSNAELKKSVNIKKLSIVVHGIFCTCNCVRSYIELHTRDMSEKLNKIAMLKMVYYIFMGKNIPDIQPSPPPTEMIQYGGSLSPGEYQQKIDNLDSSYIRELEDNNFASLCAILNKDV